MKKKLTEKYKKLLNIISELRWKIRESSFGRWWYWKIENPYLYPARCWFNPRHKKLRDSIPRTWADSVELITIVNFAFITEFVEGELGGEKEVGKLIGFYSKLDESQQKWAEFYDWLIEAYDYITTERPELEKQLSAAYPKLSKDPLAEINSPKYSYKEKYGEVDRIEKIIDKKDTEILLELIKNKDFFWT